jgi:hypothetical protein
MDNEQFKALKMPFSNILVKPGQGGGFKYVQVNDVIERMNDTFKGQWSTQVISHDIKEDQILILARVSVRDDDHPDNIYFHDGFASHPITRYTYGDNKGKAIDFGKSYTSALSKAIKQACKKWGVVLNIDEEVEVEVDSDTSGSGATFNTIPSTIPAGIPTVSTVPTVPTTTTTVPNVPGMPTESFGFPRPTTTITTPNVPNVPDLSVRPTVVAPSKNSNSVASNVSTLPSTPMPTQDKTTGIPTVPRTNTQVSNPGFMGSVNNANNQNKISEVQKAALQGILALKTTGKPQAEVDAFYVNMAKEAFAKKKINKDVIPAIDDLNYEDAIIVVKYGNELLRGNR